MFFLNYYLFDGVNI